MSGHDKLPHALAHFCSVAKGRRLVFFLDYDGTLTPIVQNPDYARISESARETLRKLARRYPVAVITGRGLGKIRSLVQLEHLIYAGSHGFDIDGPTNLIAPYTVGSEMLPALEASVGRVEQDILPRYEGCTVEDNRFSVSVHYRNCNLQERQLAELESDVMVIAKELSLKVTYGKKVLELRPNIDWNKGKAVEYLLDALQLNTSEVLPIYIGDDTTDEDAFRVLRNYEGISVLVADMKTAEQRYTAANCHLPDPEEVHKFLAHFLSDADGVAAEPCCD